ncbi:TIM barrel protein [Candidatus Poribacteria bacterium]|nr:TIM barrel protein [Candidatus Poribacteria bacterium]
MKVGIGALHDVQATVDRCSQLGVGQVYIACASLPGYQENGYPDPASLREFKGRLEENGLEVPSACYWFAKWPPRPWRNGSTNPDILLSRDRRCINAMLRMIEILGKVGITSVLHYLDLGKPIDNSQEEACSPSAQQFASQTAWEGLIDIYRELIPVAESYGVGIGNHSLHRCLPDGLREQAVTAEIQLEDFGSYMTDGWGGPFLVGKPEELRRLVNAVPSPCNGVTLCTGMDIVGGDVPALIEEFAGKSHFCQIRDHDARWPAAQEVFLGEGRLDFPCIFTALRDAGYNGIVNPEHLGKPRCPGEDLQAKGVAYVKSQLAALEIV